MDRRPEAVCMHTRLPRPSSPSSSAIPTGTGVWENRYRASTERYDTRLPTLSLAHVCFQAPE